MDNSFGARVKRRLVTVVNAIPPLHRFVNRRLINKYAHATPARPRPLSMAAPYPT